MNCFCVVFHPSLLPKDTWRRSAKADDLLAKFGLKKLDKPIETPKCISRRENELLIRFFCTICSPKHALQVCIKGYAYMYFIVKVIRIHLWGLIRRLPWWASLFFAAGANFWSARALSKRTWFEFATSTMRNCYAVERNVGGHHQYRH